MADKTWRDNGAGPSGTWRDAGGYGGAQAGAESSLLRLPSALGDWQIEKALSSRGSEADLLVVTNEVGERRVAKIYRHGVEPNTEVLERVGGTDFEHVVELFDHGQSDGRWYELLEYVEHGSLWDLIRREGPRLSVPRIREILREMAGAIHHLHACDVVHRDIKPDNVLVRSLEPLDLVLADFGIASVLGQASRRYTENANRTVAYAALETMGGELSRSADWWSLGIILVEVLTGQHPFAARTDLQIVAALSQMPVDDLVNGVEEPWRFLCRGLLRRQPRNRWGHDEIRRWLNDDAKNLKVVEEAAPKLANDIAPFFFEGTKQYYGSFPEIARAFGSNWAAARRAVEGHYLLDWVKDFLKDSAWYQVLRELDRNCSDLDERVFRIIIRSDRDEATVPMFCGHRLDEEGLERLARQALAEQQNDSGARSVLEKVRRQNILELAADSSRRPHFAQLATTWNELLQNYQLHRNALVQAGGPNVGTQEPLGEMLLVTLPGTRGSYVSSLRKRAQETATTDAQECVWFRELANGIERSIPAVLLLIPQVASQAEDETFRIRRKKQNDDAEILKAREWIRLRKEILSYMSGYGVLCGALAAVFRGLLFAGVVPPSEEPMVSIPSIDLYADDSVAISFLAFLFLTFISLVVYFTYRKLKSLLQRIVAELRQT